MPHYPIEYLEDIIAELVGYGYKTKRDQVQLLLALINFILYKDID
jgi:hypothetical protein